METFDSYVLILLRWWWGGGYGSMNYTLLSPL